MKKVLILLLVGLFIAPLSMSAQDTRPHLSCGTSMETQEILKRNMIELRNRYPNVATSRAVAYVPVWFHMVALSDGTGRATQANVAEMLCEWNRIYEVNGVEIQFYIKGFSEINLDALYKSPQSFAGTNRMLTTKKADAMNVYLTLDAGDGSRPTEKVLAYYSNKSSSFDPEYANDWIVCSISEVNAGNAPTIAHEAGHFFSLPHTFYGWESVGEFKPTAAAPCAPASVNYNGRIIEVEKVARTGATKNCTTAADGFCDTPEDYYLGFVPPQNTCIYTGAAKDPDCVQINPDETNIMGYFSCPSTFSIEQKNAMRNNYLNHAGRAYLRNGNITPPLTSALPTLITPTAGSVTSFYNNVQLDWSDVPNAIGYAVDVSRTSSFISSTKKFYVTSSDLNVNSVNATVVFPLPAPPDPPLTGFTVYWRVRAIVPYKNCEVATGNFRVGTLNAVNEIAGVTQFTVSPNPLIKGQNLSLEMNSETAFDAKIKLVNMTGQLIKTEKRTFAAGYSAQTISVSDLTNGTYILSVESDKGVLNKRIVIQ
jgi:hypothetical protein